MSKPGDFVIRNGVLSRYTGSSNQVIVPNGVTRIDGCVFENHSELKNVEIPDSVNKIGGFAFCGCTGLTHIEIPNGVTEIGGHAFEGCTGLISVTFPGSVRCIEKETFKGCSRLARVELAEGLEEICYRAFSGCTGMTGLEIPNSVEEIAKQIVPKSVTLIVNAKSPVLEEIIKNKYEYKLKDSSDNSAVQKVVESLKSTIVKISYGDFRTCDFHNSCALFLDCEKEMKQTIKEQNITVLKELSDKVDYLFCDKKSLEMYDDSSRNSENDLMLLKAIESFNRTGKPVFINPYKYLKAIRDDYLQRCVNESLEEKINRASETFESCCNMIYEAMDKIGDYDFISCIVDGCTGIHLEKNTDYSIEEYNAAIAFLSSVASGYAETAINEFDCLLEKGRSGLDGYGGVKLPIAVAVAAFVFCDPELDAYIEWARDKWEYRGDYSSSFKLYLTLNYNYPNGFVGESEDEPYNNMISTENY